MGLPHPHAGRPRPPAHGQGVQLGLPQRARAVGRRAARLLPARARDRRLLVDQRHGVHPGPRPRLRRLGRAGAPRLELRRRPPLLPAVREPRPGCRRVARRGRAAPRIDRRVDEPPLRRLHRGGTPGRLPGHRGHERLPAGRTGPHGHDDVARAPVERGPRLARPRPPPAEPRGGAPRPRDPRAVRRKAGGRGGLPRPGTRAERRHHRGSHPLGRRDQLSPTPPSLRGRAGRRAPPPRNRGSSRISPGSARTSRTTSRSTSSTPAPVRSPSTARSSPSGC